MNSTRNSRFRISAAVLAAAISVSLCAAATARAQSSQIVPRLPVSTVSYVEWRGSNALAASSKDNHVMQLMADPAMAPLWLGMAANFQKQQRESKASAPPLTMPEVVSLLQNPAVFGIIELPHAAEVSPGGKPPKRMAVFVVYDATGKADLIGKLEAASDTRGRNPQTITHYDFGGTSVEVRSSKTGASYSALAGSYFFASDHKRTIEQLITRFSSAAVPADSITQRPEYAEVRKFVATGDAFEFFARMPNAHDMIPSNAKNQNGQRFLKSIHLDKISAAGGSVSFAGPEMHVRGAILGNTQPTGPFDIAGASSATFRTQAIAGGAPEFSATRVNLAAVYRLFYAAIVPNLPPQQASSVSAVEGMAQGFLGMSIPDALDLFTGEMASASSFSTDGAEEQVFAATIQKPESVLHILRAVLGPMTLAEDTYGDATTLDVAAPYRDPATGLQRRKMYYVAVTPQMLVVAPRKVLLRELLSQMSAAGALASAPKGVFADPQYVQLRALMPATLSGLGYVDMSEIPWGPVLAKFASSAQQSAQAAAQQAAHASKNGQSVHPPDFSWLGLVDPNVIPRHLHMMVSGWWKDTNGVYFDSYIQ
ncbi:MAG TPA: hypothetical protein VNK23_10940 [Candidatus Dormibacteraeota bacterium]|nr:hypothetical protein [Candidatus Dormibacteraeota bacterium]